MKPFHEPRRKPLETKKSLFENQKESCSILTFKPEFNDEVGRPIDLSIVRTLTQDPMWTKGQQKPLSSEKIV